MYVLKKKKLKFVCYYYTALQTLNLTIILFLKMNYDDDQSLGELRNRILALK